MKYNKIITQEEADEYLESYAKLFILVSKNQKAKAKN